MKTNLTTRIAALATGACMTFLILNGISFLAEVEYAAADQQMAQSSPPSAEHSILLAASL